jgi:TfoX/Sxy family transcriptional regulator of competence genes
MPRKPVKKAAAKRAMPTFSKPSQHTLAVFERAVARMDGIERRTMFGYPSAFANGNMAACVFQDRIMVRLSETDRAAALELPGAKSFEPSPGRPMREYVDFPRAVLDDPSSIEDWMRRGVAYAAGLPAKKKKAGGRQAPSRGR